MTKHEKETVSRIRKKRDVILPQRNLSGHNIKKKKTIICWPFYNLAIYLVKFLYTYTIYWPEEKKYIFGEKKRTLFCCFADQCHLGVPVPSGVCLVC